MSYSLQKVSGRYNITVKSQLVKSKGWEKGQGLDLNIVKGKIKVSEGDQTKLQYAHNRYFIHLPIAGEMGWEKGQEFEWRVDGNGDLVLQPK